MREFLDRVAEVLEVPEIGASDDFRAVPMWGSLMGFGLIVMIGQKYGRKVSAADIIAARTVSDLASLAGVAG
ncbi:MAG: acyl carrier protein [Kiritimatiellae bacterium]|nr:acyl carrier protein [Kiritimatiellia bacterium]